MADTKVILTEDGSKTLFSPKYQEHYHSVFGAIQESMHVFIRAGLLPKTKTNKHIRIFEMGMGTGLNVLLTYLHKQDCSISYLTLEAEPVAIEQACSLKYTTQLSTPNLEPLFQQIHTTAWNEEAILDETFTLHKRHTQIQAFESSDQFDLFYFDAFAPDVQPELWNETIMEKLAHMAAPNAIFVTYSVKGTVRRALQKFGFKTERIPGPPGKRQMLRAIMCE